jgi:hypothetical protein
LADKKRIPASKSGQVVRRTSAPTKVAPPPAGASALSVPNYANIGDELGSDQNLPFSTPFLEAKKETTSSKEQLYEQVQSWDDADGPQIYQLVNMRKMDGQARALYRLITLPIRASMQTASFVAAEGGDAEQKFIEQVFTLPAAQGGMTTPWNRVMAQILSAIFDGFSAFEQVFWIPEKGPLKGKVTLKKLAYRPSETVNFITDDNGGFAGIRQRAQVNGKWIDTYIPRDRCFYYAAQEEEKKFYGVSFFQSAYYHYDKKMKMYFIAHLAAQRAAVGTRVGSVPNNATAVDRQKFASSLSNLAVAQYMMYPEGFEVEVLREGGSFDFLNYINHHNSQMSKSILATFFDEDKGGGSADSKMINFASSGDDMFILMLQSIMSDIETAVNSFIIPKLIDYNFGSGKYPSFTFGKLTQEQKAAAMDLFKTLATAGQGINTTPEFMRELEEQATDQLGLQVDYKAVEKREKAEQAASQAMQDASQQAALAPAGGVDPNADPQQAAVDSFEQQAMALTAEEEEAFLGLSTEELSTVWVEADAAMGTWE